MTAELVWGLKASLRSYVEALPDGSIEASDSASRSDSGEFRFPFVERVDAAGSSELRYAGTITLTGHSNAMRISVSEPRIHLSDDRAVLSVRDAEGDDPTLRMEVARIAVVRSELEWFGSPVRLTADGAAILGALQYYEGQPVDDVRFSEDQAHR